MFDNIKTKTVEFINTISDAVTPDELKEIGTGLIEVTTTFKDRKITVVGFNYNGNIGFLSFFKDKTQADCFGNSEVISLLQKHYQLI